MINYYRNYFEFIKFKFERSVQCYLGYRSLITVGFYFFNLIIQIKFRFMISLDLNDPIFHLTIL